MSKPIKVFILAGDENMLEQGVIEGRTPGIHDAFYPNSMPTTGERKKHVKVAVYKGAYSPDSDYDKLEPELTGEVEVGDQLTQRAQNGQAGRVPVPMTPFPELSRKDGTTTVLRGYVSVKFAGKYEFLPGAAEAAFNVTTVEGKEVYRRNPGQQAATLAAVELEPGKRYAFKTVFFKKPGPDFRIPLTNMPGTLTTVVAENPHYAFLRDDAGKWVTRNDVALYDAQPIHNNTKTIGHFLQVGGVSYGGQQVSNAIGPDLMFGHVMGNHFDEPVLLLRFATRHPIWFLRGSRSLGHDYRPPSSGGTADHDGGWDVIHFNWGVWDAVYRDSTSKFFKGRHITSVADYEKNLRTLVARLKRTGATLIWASTTPVYEGEPGRINGDETAYNAVAAKIMKENGVIINDLHAESIRQGYPKSINVHSVGNLAPKVTDTILAALAARKQSTKPLPRVLLIGDSITGSYEKQVMRNLDGKAFVCKNPGNGEYTWTGVAKIDEWLDLKQYLLNGQEYLELIHGVTDALKHLERVCPGYQGQGGALAGLVWFQGIKDSMSDSMAADYEKNLVNLIKDVRKDLKTPDLPVVVAAVGFDGEKMNANTLKIFEAQMAVGDPARHPGFAGTVKSVDTRKFWRQTARSPGGHACCYQGNAETFLEIGEALGQTMMEQSPEGTHSD
jgi:lysophospholipase L1-like esterase